MRRQQAELGRYIANEPGLGDVENDVDKAGGDDGGLPFSAPGAQQKKMSRGQEDERRDEEMKMGGLHQLGRLFGKHHALFISSVVVGRRLRVEATPLV